MEPSIAEVILSVLFGVPCFIAIIAGIVIGIRASREGRRRVRPEIYGYGLQSGFTDVSNWGKK